MVYNKACSVAREIGIVEEMPRTTSHQKHRSNPPAATPKEYYSHTISIPMLDHLNSQLMERFSDTSSSHISEFLSLLPSQLYGSENFTRGNISTLFEMYKDDLPEEYAFDTEVQAWHLKWKDDSSAKDINTMPKVLAVTSKTVFPGADPEEGHRGQMTPLLGEYYISAVGT